MPQTPSSIARWQSRCYLPSVPKIGRSKLYTILTDRSYIGEIKFRGQWHPGTHTPLVEPKLWDRVPEEESSE